MGPGHESVGRLLMGFDLITVGRVTMDLHAQDIGAPFAEVSGFDTSVGGSPTNIAIGAARLGLRPIAFSAVGDDLVGDYVLRYLADAGFDPEGLQQRTNRLVEGGVFTEDECRATGVDPVPESLNLLL